MSIWQLCANLLIPNCLRSNLSYSPLAALELYVNLSNLLRFSQNYKPNRLFVEWVKSAEYIILNEIERFAPQNTLQGMYLVEEFV